MRKATPKAKKSAKAPGSFGEGLEAPAPRPARPVTCLAVENRLLALLRPLVEAQGGVVATLDEVGEADMHGLAITLRNGQSYDIIVREHQK